MNLIDIICAEDDINQTHYRLPGVQLSAGRSPITNQCLQDDTLLLHQMHQLHLSCNVPATRCL